MPEPLTFKETQELTELFVQAVMKVGDCCHCLGNWINEDGMKWWARVDALESKLPWPEEYLRQEI